MDEKLLILFLPIVLLILVLGWAILIIRSGKDLNASFSGLGIKVQFVTQEKESKDGSKTSESA